MPVQKRLLINNQPVPLAAEHVQLALSQVGAGVFDVLADLGEPRNALVELYAGYPEHEEYRVMMGAVTNCERVDQGRTRVTARELSAVLDLPGFFHLRHPTPRDVIHKIERTTRLHFLLPKGASYLQDRRIDFVFNGPCSQALELLAKRWELSGMVWCQLPDATIYWGHWSTGPYTGDVVPLEDRLVQSFDKQRQTITLPYIPALRPGMVMQGQFRFRIDSLAFNGEQVQVSWTRV